MLPWDLVFLCRGSSTCSTCPAVVEKTERAQSERKKRRPGWDGGEGWCVSVFYLKKKAIPVFRKNWTYQTQIFSLPSFPFWEFVIRGRGDSCNFSSSLRKCMFTTNSSVWWRLQICYPDSCVVLKRLRRECTHLYLSWPQTVFLITLLESVRAGVCAADSTEVEQSPGACQRKEGGGKGRAQCVSQHGERGWCTPAATFTMPICHGLVLKSDLISFTWN